MKSKKIIIAGGSGFLGNILAEHFVGQGYEVLILSRKKQLNKGDIRYVTWDAKSMGTWKEEMESADVLINLTGKSVDCRYTETNKRLIYDSRLNSTKILGDVLKELNNPPKLWINAASATIYRHAMDREMDEETGEIGEGFSVDVCKQWEQTFRSIEVPKTRKVTLRIAIVLGKKGGALAPLKRLVKVGLGGKQGAGNQFFSWLHEKDFAGIIDFIISNDKIEGVYNATSPNPITNQQIMKELRSVLQIPFGIPMPVWLLKVGALLISTETELILKSRRVVPKKLIDSGFKFQYETIDSALADLTN